VDIAACDRTKRYAGILCRELLWATPRGHQLKLSDALRIAGLGKARAAAIVVAPSNAARRSLFITAPLSPGRRQYQYLEGVTRHPRKSGGPGELLESLEP
jgi:hypothetical protein